MSAVLYPAPDDRPFAVVDIGSNSGRMIVFRLRDGEHLDVIEDARAPLRLARDLRDSDTLGPEAIERTLEALRDFKAVARGAGAARMIAVATAAVRDAADGDELVERAQHLGVPAPGDRRRPRGAARLLRRGARSPGDERAHDGRGRRQRRAGALPRPTARARVVDAARLPAHERPVPRVGSARRGGAEGAPQVRLLGTHGCRDHRARGSRRPRRHRRYRPEPRQGRSEARGLSPAPAARLLPEGATTRRADRRDGGTLDEAARADARAQPGPRRHDRGRRARGPRRDAARRRREGRRVEPGAARGARARDRGGGGDPVAPLGAHDLRRDARGAVRHVGPGTGGPPRRARIAAACGARPGGVTGDRGDARSTRPRSSTWDARSTTTTGSSTPR